MDEVEGYGLTARIELQSRRAASRRPFEVCLDSFHASLAAGNEPTERRGWSAVNMRFVSRLVNAPGWSGAVGA
jgi:hypothetical protein